MSRRRRVLLTGFGPFPGVPVNASARLAAALAEEAGEHLPGWRFLFAELPTQWGAAIELRGRLVERHRPVLALHFGVSSRARGFVIETRAVNRRGAIADAEGCLPGDASIVPGGPALLRSELPAALILSRLRRRGIPAAVSRDAGTYLCNALLYDALGMQRGDGEPRRTGFIHIPDGLESPPAAAGALRRRALRTALDWSMALEGGLEIVRTCLRQAPPPR